MGISIAVRQASMDGTNVAGAPEQAVDGVGLIAGDMGILSHAGEWRWPLCLPGHGLTSLLDNSTVHW
jgi:hypothetical protein